MKTLALALAVLLALPATALAKSGLGLQGAAPVDLAVGEPWYAVAVAIRHDRPTSLPRSADPAVTIEKRGSAETRRFPARRHRGHSYVARVVFPAPGTWTFRLTGFGSLGADQEWEPVEVHAAAGSRAGSGPDGGADASSAGGDDFPFGWITAGSSILIALGLFVERRRRGTQPGGRGPDPEA
jgi:hypothetical protein